MKSLINASINLFLYHFSRVIKNQQVYFKKIGLKVGTNCRILTNKFGSEPFLITIGNNVTLASGVRLITHDGSGCLMSDEKGRRYLFQPISIGNNVFVGANCMLMPGVKIEDNVVVAAGAVVTKSIPSGSVVAGVPAKIIGTFDDLKSRMLNDYVSKKDFEALSGTENERISKLTTYTFKPYLHV